MRGSSQPPLPSDAIEGASGFSPLAKFDHEVAISHGPSLAVSAMRLAQSSDTSSTFVKPTSFSASCITKPASGMKGMSEAAISRTG